MGAEGNLSLNLKVTQWPQRADQSHSACIDFLLAEEKEEAAD